VVRRSRDEGARTKEKTTTYPTEGSETGGADFIPWPAVTLADRNRGARDRAPKGRAEQVSTSLSDTRGPHIVGPPCR
jgi:hypothetical protein